MYGPWDAFPPRSEAREVHAGWLHRYLPMVQEGTIAYLEISDSTLFTAPLPPDVVASVFAGFRTYLVLANYRRASVTVETTRPYTADDAPKDTYPSRRWELAPRSLRILVRS
jgi:hypothetical protein